MKICTSREEMLAVSTGWAADGQTVCLIPTMGNLHDGHFVLAGYRGPAWRARHHLYLC